MKLSEIFATGKGEPFFKFIIAGLSFIASNILGGWDMALQTLVVVIIIDYVTGILASASEGKLSSSVGFKGIIKKVTIFTMVALATRIEGIVGMEYVRLTVVYFYTFMEAVSVLENADRIGLPIPDFFRKLLQQSVDNSNTGGGNGDL